MPIAIVGGGAIGFLLDRALGTLPVFSLVFLVFGVAAGIRNVVRAASAAAPPPARPETPADPDENPTRSAE